VDRRQACLSEDDSYRPLPNATTTQFNHGITNIDTVVDLLGAATNPGGDYLRLPHVHCQTIGKQIGFFIGPALITVSTGADYSTYTEAHVTMRYTCTGR
jgi:hypothetical protein